MRTRLDVVCSMTTCCWLPWAYVLCAQVLMGSAACQVASPLARSCSARCTVQLCTRVASAMLSDRSREVAETRAVMVARSAGKCSSLVPVA
jgi:hypothetical protein